MNLIIASLIIIGAPKAPRIFYYDGKNLSTLDAIFVSNIRQGSFQFFVKSPYELEYASVDSTDVVMYLPDKVTTEKMRLTGRWYRINWESRLRTGSEKHIVFLTARSGSVFKKSFVVNVEGAKKLEKPHGENR